jgi:hypothetical protein
MKNNYTIQCVVTGKDLVRTPQYLRQQCQKYGFENVEDFRKQYIGREGRKLLKEGKTVEEIRSQFQCSNNTPLSSDTLIRFKVQKSSGKLNLRSPEKPTLKKDPNCPF